MESGEAVTGDKEGEGCVWHHHAAGPRWRRTYISCLAALEQDEHTDRLCDEGLALHLGGREGGSAAGREACDLTGWANGQ